MTALNLSILLSIIFTDVCGDDSNVVDFSHSITVSHCVDSHHVNSQWYTVYNIIFPLEIMIMGQIPIVVFNMSMEKYQRLHYYRLKWLKGTICILVICGKYHGNWEIQKKTY